MTRETHHKITIAFEEEQKETTLKWGWKNSLGFFTNFNQI